MQHKKQKKSLISSNARVTLEYVVNSPEIARRREMLGLTMAEAAERAGFNSRQQWYGIESGERKDPASSTLAAVAKALQCRMDDLMTEK